MQLFDYAEAGATDAAGPAIVGPTAAERRLLQGFAAERTYPAGSQIVAAGSADSALYFVVSGQVAAGHAQIRAGGAFNLCAFLDGAPGAGAAVAGEAACVLALTREQFDRLAAWQPLAALGLLKALAAMASRRLRDGGGPL